MLPSPTGSVVQKLREAAKADGNSAAWVIDLDTFYRKQDLGCPA